MDKTKKILYELIIGIIMFMFVEIIGYIFLTGDVFRHVVGCMLGSAIAVFLVWHLYDTLGQALDLDEENAVKFSRKRYAVRMLIVAICLLIVVFLSRYISVGATLVAIFSVKFSAYIQPFTNKFISKKFFN